MLDSKEVADLVQDVWTLADKIVKASADGKLTIGEIMDLVVAVAKLARKAARDARD
jgi:hypothetical protein